MYEDGRWLKKTVRHGAKAESGIRLRYANSPGLLDRDIVAIRTICAVMRRFFCWLIPDCRCTLYHFG